MWIVQLLLRVPLPVGQRIVRGLPHRIRVLLVRRAGRLRTRRWWGRRPPGIGGRTVVCGAGGALPATVRAVTSPVHVRRDNLTNVMAALDAAGVPYFRVPGTPEQRTALALPAECRARALTAVTALAGAVLRGRDATARRSLRLADAAVVEAFWPVTNAAATMVLAETFACDIEFWAERGSHLFSPREPFVTPPVHRDSPVVHAAERDFGQFCPATDDGVRFPTRRELLLVGMDWVRFPIDAVYTWVDGSDPRWQQGKAAALQANGWANINAQAANGSRYLSRDELRYSLRSQHYFAPWIRRVFLVTDAQVPPWMDVDHPALTVVDHREIFGTAGRLPTFNSHAIESRLHHIAGLAEHFIYLNDDVFVGSPLTPSHFFLPSGLAKFFLSGAAIEAGPVRPDEPPVMSAGKNNRDVVAQHFGRLLTRKTQHTPHPQRRSVLAEIEQRCRGKLLGTAQHQFRHPDDVSVPSSLQHYWSYLSGRAVPGKLRYLYVDLADPRTPLRLMALLRQRKRDVFCLNDTRSSVADQRAHAELLATFLPAYFPFRAPYELADAGVAQRQRGEPTPLTASPTQPAGSPAPRRERPEQRQPA